MQKTVRLTMSQALARFLTQQKTEIDGRIAGSCFYHPRDSHVGLGIMNAAPEFAGRGVAKALLTEILERAGELPVRLVSSVAVCVALFPSW